VSVADVEAEYVLLGMTRSLLDVEDEVRGQVVHGEGLVRSDDPRACCASWWREEDITFVTYDIIFYNMIYDVLYCT